jgi:hypothetical protein
LSEVGQRTIFKVQISRALAGSTRLSGLNVAGNRRMKKFHPIDRQHWNEDCCDRKIITSLIISFSEKAQENERFQRPQKAAAI